MKNKTISYLKWFFFSMLWVFLLVFLLDIVSKQLVANHMEINQTINLIPGFLSITYILNPGAGFGLFKNLDDVARRILLISISVIMTGAFFIYYGLKYKTLALKYKVGLMLLAGGAFGNLIDRAFYPNGYVIDFIDVDLGSYTTFPIFNIADSALTIGIIYIIIVMLIDEIKGHNSKKACETSINDKSLPNSGDSLNSTIDKKSNEEKGDSDDIKK